MGAAATPREFMELVQPALAAGDVSTLARLVLSRWSPHDLCPLLRHEEANIRRVAAVVVGLVGDRAVEPCLVRALRDPDPQVNEMAQHGLSSIWFRSGSACAAGPFRAGVAMLESEEFAAAIDKFHEAQRLDAGFVEAFNQCAVAHYFLGQYRQSVEDCCRAIQRVPDHFGAIAGMGHSYAHMGELTMALRCYRRALRINPYMPALGDAIAHLQRRIHDTSELLAHPIADPILNPGSAHN